MGKVVLFIDIIAGTNGDAYRFPMTPIFRKILPYPIEFTNLTCAIWNPNHDQRLREARYESEANGTFPCLTEVEFGRRRVRS